MALAFACACSGWTAAPQRGHAAVLKRQLGMSPVVLKEKIADGELLMVVLRTLERLEAKLDYLEGKVDNMGAQGLEQKWRLERLEGKVSRSREHRNCQDANASLHSSRPGPRRALLC